MPRRNTLAVCAGALAAAAAANAAITGVSGSITNFAPPNVDVGAAESNTTMFAFDERQNVALPFGVDLNMAGVPATISANPGVVGSLAAGTVVDSHFIHFDQVGPGFTQLTGSVTFARPIIGVQLLSAQLFSTDADLGAPGVLYPPMSPAAMRRGLDWDGPPTPPEIVSISPDRLTITVTLGTSNVIDQVRVLTEPIPSPGAAAVMALAAAALGRRRR